MVKEIKAHRFLLEELIKRDFKKKYKLNKPNGKMDTKTLNAMVKE